MDSDNLIQIGSQLNLSEMYRVTHKHMDCITRSSPLSQIITTMKHVLSQWDLHCAVNELSRA